MKTYYKLVSDLEHNLKALESKIENMHCQSEQCIILCKNTLEKLKESVSKETFKNQEYEIEFYKHIKPKVLSYLIFYVKRFTIESKRPKTGKKEQVKYLKGYISKLQTFFNNNLEFYHYYKSNATHFDEQYFLIKNKTTRLNIEAYFVFTDTNFSTSHCTTVATIMAYTNLIAYLNSEINQLENKTMEKIHPFQKQPQLNWTANKTDLVELIYALQRSGAINNGTAEIKELANTCQKIFNINLGDYYRTYLEIRFRKINQTKFIDKLKNSLTHRMDESDSQ